MQLNAVKESWGSDNQSWLGSSHATDNAQTVTLDGTKLSAFVGKTIPSGIPRPAASSSRSPMPATRSPVSCSPPSLGTAMVMSWLRCLITAASRWTTCLPPRST